MSDGFAVGVGGADEGGRVVVRGCAGAKTLLGARFVERRWRKRCVLLPCRLEGANGFCRSRCFGDELTAGRSGKGGVSGFDLEMRVVEGY